MIVLCYYENNELFQILLTYRKTLTKYKYTIIIYILSFLKKRYFIIKFINYI